MDITTTAADDRIDRHRLEHHAPDLDHDDAEWFCTGFLHLLV